VPGRNLAVLKKTDSGGKGSEQTKKVGVVLKARELTRGACHPRSSTDTFSITISMVDGNSDAPFFEETRTGLTCNRRVGQEKFWPTYTVDNCAGPEPSDKSSNGKSDKNSNGKFDKNSNGKARKSSKNEITVTATTEDGELIASRTLKCNK
jgi:hypothetical protein